MPTNKVRKSRGARPDISSTHWAMLNDLEMPPDYDRWQAFDGPTREQWLQHRDEILETWIASKPGTRPRHWWVHDAPKLTPAQLLEYGGAGYARDLIQPRERVGGTGTPQHETTAIQACYALGLPDSGWDDDLDLSDLPRYEAQATYLKRHGLLAVGELRRIPKAAFLPEKITYEKISDDE